MPDDPIPSQVLSLRDLARRGARGDAVPFAHVPDGEALSRMARRLDLRELRKLRIEGTVTPEAARDWRLDARLGATVVQDCVVTLEPVVTRIEEAVRVRYLADMGDAPEAGSETEMSEGLDEVEPLAATVDLAALAQEALSLSLPAFPRAPGAELGEAVYAAPGTAPMRDEDARPFAGLGALRDKLSGGAAEE
ncbi:MAG: YceD family protein [Paracoccaceae bacterium]